MRTHDPAASRWILAALAAALVLGALPLFARGQIGGHDHSPDAVSPSGEEVAFRAEMRRLWEDHIVWTRQVVVSFAGDLPDLKRAEGRLLRNQADIGRAIAPYYGRAAGARLTALLREHILGAAGVLGAAQAGDAGKLKAAQARWSRNADQIAAFLSAANPRHWPLSEMRAMMSAHLALTLQEAVARLGGRWEADVAAYDKVHHQALAMADMLSGGIVEQFPERFRQA
jgi:hypothetical protein